MADSDLRQALLGTWRLITFQIDVVGTPVMPLGDNPQGYLVYTPDDHVFAALATRAERGWPGPEVLDMQAAQAYAALGFAAYCGTFEVRAGQVFHHVEVGTFPRASGRVLARSVVLEGERLIVTTNDGHLVEWQRVH